MKIKLFFVLNKLLKVLRRSFVCGDCCYLNKDIYTCFGPKRTRGFICGGKSPACADFWPKLKKNK